ncbi:MAG: helix-turn-helix transcriptional regulator [Eubacterium sp.]|nr:helix-turn-helix transcriptional regulator [Eubacterium sp.]
MYEEEFPIRLAKLRSQKGVSARDMSLSIGQNAGYINNIETGKALPSMSSFFFICEYLDVSPQEFFELDSRCPQKLRELMENLKCLSPEELDHIAFVVQGLAQNK